MDNDFENEIRDLLAARNKIGAVKRYREMTGASLAESKAAVESIGDGGSFAATIPPDDTAAAPIRTDDSELTGQIIDFLGRGKKLPAVKLYRDRYGCGLKEAREEVERIAAQNGIRTSSGPGCLGVVLVGIVVVIGITQIGFMT